MGYEQLEVAQRDLLTALDFTLGGSPQAIVDELWEALPSLRELFVGRRMQFWQVAQRETWLLLFEAIQGTGQFVHHTWLIGKQNPTFYASRSRYSRLAL